MKRIKKLVSLLFLSQLTLTEYLRAEQQAHNETVTGMIEALKGAEITDKNLLGTSEQTTCAEDTKTKAKAQEKDDGESASESESEDSDSASESEDEGDAKTTAKTTDAAATTEATATTETAAASLAQAKSVKPAEAPKPAPSAPA